MQRPRGCNHFPIMLGLLLVTFPASGAAGAGIGALEVVEALRDEINLLGGVQVVCKRDSELLKGSALRKKLFRLGLHVQVTESLEPLARHDHHHVICAEGSEIRLEMAEALRADAHNAADMLWYLIGGEESLQSMRESLEIAVNKQLFLLSTDTGVLWESYDVGGERVTETLGQLEAGNGSSRARIRYLPGGTVQDLLNRRANWRGLQLTAMTDMQLPFLMIPVSEHLQKNVKEGWNRTASGDEVWDVSGEIFAGIFHEMFLGLQKKLNFTARLLLRRDSTFGQVENGSWVGMVGNLVKGEADMVMAPLTVMPKRGKVIDYLWPMGKETAALYISSQELERREWLAFLYPLRAEVWTYLLINSIVLLITLKLLNLWYKKKSSYGSTPFYLMLDAIGDFWMLGASYFGRVPTLHTSRRKRAVRFLLLAAFLSGTIVFMSYRASLTAELSVKRTVVPFNNMEELLQTDYSVISLPGVANYLINHDFLNKDDPTVWLKLYEQKLKPMGKKGEFPSIEAAFDHMLASSGEPITFLGLKEVFVYFPQYHCKIMELWAQHYPGLISFGFPKDSPYRESMNHQLLKLVEEGLLQIQGQRHLEIVEKDCEMDDDVSLSFVKFISLFAVLGTGVAASVLMFVAEKLLSNTKLSLAPTQEVDDDQEDEEAKDKEKENADFLYRAKLKTLLFRWGINDRSGFTADVEELLNIRQRRSARPAHHGAVRGSQYSNGAGVINVVPPPPPPPRSPAALLTPVAKSPVPSIVNRRFTYLGASNGGVQSSTL